MPDTIRTYDLQLRRLALYPAELRAHVRNFTLICMKEQTRNVYGDSRLALYLAEPRARTEGFYSHSIEELNEFKGVMRKNIRADSHSGITQRPPKT